MHILFVGVFLLISDFLKKNNNGSTVSNIQERTPTGTVNPICNLPLSSSSGRGDDILCPSEVGKVSQLLEFQLKLLLQSVCNCICDSPDSIFENCQIYEFSLCLI